MKPMFKGVIPGFLLGAALLLAGCDINAAKDAFDEFDVIVQLDSLNTVVAAGIVDAATGNFIEGDVTLTFAGDDSGVVVDTYSDPITSYVVTGGFGAFGIQNAIVPSEANPVEFRVVANAAGYEPGSANVSITDAGTHDVAIYLSSTSASGRPTGGGVAAQSVQTTGGTVTTTTTVQTTNTPSGSSASVTIPAGATATTASGSAATGSVNLSITYYETTADAPALIPTSSYTTLQTESGATSEAAILTVTSALLKMTDAGGNRITSLSQPIQIRMGITPNNRNPATGNAFVEGEEIEIFRYDPADAVWRPAGVAKVVAESAGKSASASLALEFSTTWTGDSWVIGLVKTTNFCTVTVNLENNETGGSVSGSYSYERWEGSYSATIRGSLTALFGPDATSITLSRLPVFWSRAYTELTFSYGDEVNRLTLQTPRDCNSTQSVNLQPPPSINVTFQIAISGNGGSCAALHSTTVPAFVIKRKLQGSQDQTATTVSTQPTWTRDAQDRITGGSMVVNSLVQGRTYTFFSTIGGRRHERNATISGPNMTFDISRDVRDNSLCAND